MAVIRCDFFSEALLQGTSMTVLLPEPGEEQVGTDSVVRTGPPPVLYLLHGLSDDDSAWLRLTSIERYVSALGLAVVMPQVHRSFYTDLPGEEGRYWTFLSQELPALVSRFFNVSTSREDTFVAGLSMGGYGALKWAFAQPERFAAAASFSGAVDLQALIDEGQRAPLFESILQGRTLADVPGGDLFAAAERLDAATAPRLYLTCGTEDALLPGTEQLVALTRSLGLDVTADIGPGEHEWGLWDRQVQDVLAWLPLTPPTT